MGVDFYFNPPPPTSCKSCGKPQLDCCACNQTSALRSQLATSQALLRALEWQIEGWRRKAQQDYIPQDVVAARAGGEGRDA